MRIGVDLRSLQIGHQYRGIGEVLKRTLEGLFQSAGPETEFVFFSYEDMEDPKKLLNIPKDLQYSERSFGKKPEALQELGNKLRRNWKRLFGNPVSSAEDCDVFLQYDYELGVPTDTRTILIKHDIIPFVFWDQYFESAKVPFRHRAARTTLRTLYYNISAKRVLKRSLKNAHTIMCVSDNTRQDIHRYFGISLEKMRVMPLGAETATSKGKEQVDQNQMPTKPSLLFIGAGDARRRVDDLVDAYNNLKAKNYDIQLVLAGENFPAPEEIPNVTVRESVMSSSYQSDILTLGYINNATKRYLYQNAIAFVFPTLYEGFGLPVLEAMLFECPVITYKNSSLPEVGGEYALYADDWQGIWHECERLLNMDEQERSTLTRQAKKHAHTFQWDKTVEILQEAIESTVRK